MPAFEPSQPASYQELLMGPNPVPILDELLQPLSLDKSAKILDLGCGRGVSSMHLAQKYGCTVFAVDLWTPEAENQRTFSRFGLDKLIRAVNADALALPFPDNFFDAVVTVDAYHYFGGNASYYGAHIKNRLKKGGVFAASVPGMRHEMGADLPEEMQPHWPKEALALWHSLDWWKPLLEPFLKDAVFFEMSCFNKAWADWLSTENPYALEDREMIAQDGGRYMNLLALRGFNR